MAIHKETVLKRFLLILGDPAIVLHSQVDSIVADGCPGAFPDSAANAGTARDDSMDAERSRAQSFFFIRCTFLS